MMKKKMSRTSFRGWSRGIDGNPEVVRLWLR